MFQGFIFGVGVNKSGTHSLCDALNLLGIRSLHHSFLLEETVKLERSNGGPLLSTWTAWYRAFLDYPIPLLFPELDRLYPGSKFIQTTRPLDQWIDSRICHIERDRRLTKEGKIRYGWIEEIRPQQWASEYQQHHEAIAQYFTGRENDLLVLDICQGEGWETLCMFLDADVPESPFPHAYRRDASPQKLAGAAENGAS